MSKSLAKLEAVALRGDEAFTADDTAKEFSVLDFWRWGFSDLMSNANRGVLAEFIVAKALGLTLDQRDEWGDYDLVYNGLKIEVKSSAYVQTWGQRKLSSPSFDIAPRTTRFDTATGKTVKLPHPSRAADVFVFALLNNPDITTTDAPLNLAHWEFYVLPTSQLNAHCADAKRISLKQLRALAPQAVGFEGIRGAVPCHTLSLKQTIPRS